MNYFKVEVGMSKVGGGGVKLRGKGVTNGKSVVRRCIGSMEMVATDFFVPNQTFRLMLKPSSVIEDGLPLTFLFLTRRFS